MIENLPLYIEGETEEHWSILEELSQLKLTKKPVYSANLIRYALMLGSTLPFRNTSSYSLSSTYHLYQF